ncbi:MAG: LuxR family transcriptional regulator [Methylococcaceae bacterium]|nr:MAG: LuxR family transcriptional regulator [Methylococcaceae bacterium]
MRPTPAKTLAALRQLALLQLGGAMAIPEAVGLLRAQVGFDAATLNWLDAGGNSIDLIHFPDAAPAPAAAAAMEAGMMTHEHLSVALDYLEHFHNKVEGEGLCGYTMRAAHASGGIVLAAPDRAAIRREYVNSAFYQRVIIPLGYGWNRLLPIRHSDRSPLAILHLGRRLNMADFSPGDERFFQQAHPWLQHLLRHDTAPAGRDSPAPAGESVMLILDKQGKVLAASTGALAVLHQATDMPLKTGLLRSTVQGKVDDLLKRLVKPVEAAMYGAQALPPEVHINNRWGCFYLRAYALSAFATGTPLQISLHIERRQPLSLRLFRSTRFIELSVREREVCLHVLAGQTHSEIAQAMGVKLSTVIYFIRQIYRRLGINRQSELLPALLHCHTEHSHPAFDGK